MTDQYAVVGNPIAHSKSPQIHSLFAEQTGQALEYKKILIPLGEFESHVAQFFAAGGKGLNVTVPFKEDAWHFADKLTPRAHLAGAVNTLAIQGDGKILGDTTDGLGLVGDLMRNNMPIRDAKILILGAGGAVRGVLQPIFEKKPAKIVIANRTLSKAQSLAKIFAPFGAIRACSFDELGEVSFDTVINGTSASLAGEVPPISGHVISPATSAYDMMYGPKLTPFLAWAEDQGSLNLADGLGMLVGQAAESFRLWRGVLPDVVSVMDTLR